MKREVESEDLEMRGEAKQRHHRTGTEIDCEAAGRRRREIIDRMSADKWIQTGLASQYGRAFSGVIHISDLHTSAIYPSSRKMFCRFKVFYVPFRTHELFCGQTFVRTRARTGAELIFNVVVTRVSDAF